MLRLVQPYVMAPATPCVQAGCCSSWPTCCASTACGSAAHCGYTSSRRPAPTALLTLALTLTLTPALTLTPTPTPTISPSPTLTSALTPTPPGTDRTLLRERVLTLLQRINIDATVEEVCTPPRLQLAGSAPPLSAPLRQHWAHVQITAAAPTHTNPHVHVRLQVLEVEPSSLMPYMQEEKTKGWQQRHADEQVRGRVGNSSP